MRLKFNTFMFRISLNLLLMVLSINSVYSQIEHVPVTHPVYTYLLHMETKGYIENFSLTTLPLQRQEIVIALQKILINKSKLNNSDLASLELFEKEFEILNRSNSVLFFSSTDSTQVLSNRFISNDEKFIYHYKDSSYTVNVSPLGSFESIIGFNKTETSNVIYGNLGVRFFGSLNNTLGYYLQATNGAVISGNRELALQEVHKLRQNIKFTELNSDFDFAESHVRFQMDWFYAILGRETLLQGAGINKRLYLSDNAPQFDAISIGASFLNFEYRFTHGSLLSIPIGNLNVGVAANIPSKYVAIHRFAIKPSWGEIGFWENVIYSRRGIDLAYLNPLSFFKSLEHALRDRDNSIMGIDATIRPFNGIQLKGTYLLDDIIFERIGSGYWSNKSAWNIGIIASIFTSTDIAIEYARIEPYTFSHFDTLNVMANDRMLYGSELMPNSDEISLNLYYWWGERYPVIIKLSYQRHGENYIDSTGKFNNVGGDPFLTRRYGIDSDTVFFLDGRRINTINATFEAGYELFRGLTIHLLYHLKSFDNLLSNAVRLTLRFEDF